MPAPAWPELRWDDWKDTCTTLHLYTQIVGKVRVARTPWVNHSWHVALHPTPRGLTTTPMPDGQRTFAIDLDFIDHRLNVLTSDGALAEMELVPRSVAEFHARLMALLDGMGLSTRIHGTPNEIPDPIPFAEDEVNGAYDAQAVARFHRALDSATRVLQDFRSRFLGKVSPVHFFWGSFDLAVTRFSGRRAPPHPGGIPHLPDAVTREAYSHEVSSAGWWPGGPMLPEAIFYSYAYPTPAGFADAVMPDGGRWLPELGEFILPYELARTSADPDGSVLSFLEATYAAAAEGAQWDRDALEWSGSGAMPIGVPPS